VAPLDDQGVVIVTGACGHIGREVCRLLKSSETPFLPADVRPADGVTLCDLTIKSDLSRLFDICPVRSVIHLAAVLPTAFERDPLTGADVNLTGSIHLLRQAVKTRVKRFVFGSSMSVYGSSSKVRVLTEEDPAVPDEPYGAAKRAVELIGQALARANAIEFVSLRIARVVGRGIAQTSSPWRSDIFETSFAGSTIQIPYAPDAQLSLVHVEDVARMLILLAETPHLDHVMYNTPVELWEAQRLKQVVEQRQGICIELSPNGSSGGPGC